MSYSLIMQYCIKCHSQGYYATRQQILKNGGTLYDVAKVLSLRLFILGAS